MWESRTERLPSPAQRKTATKPAPSLASRAGGLVAMQHLAGNAATVLLLEGARLSAPSPAVAAAALGLQRDIEPGKPLPDTAAIGQKRLEDRLTQEQKSARIAAGFGAKLDATAWDDSVVNRLISQRRTDIDGFYRRMFAKQNPADPDKVDQLVQEKIDELVPTSIAALLVKIELWELVSGTPGLTADAAKRAMAAKFPPDQPKGWLAGAIIDTAEAGNIADVEAKLKQDAAAEWQRIAGRAEGASFGSALSKAEKAAFAAELKALPSLSRIAGAHGGDKSALAMMSAAKWRGGGFLHDDIAEVNEDNDKKPIPPKKLYRRPIDDGTFRRKAFEADKMIRALVEPEVLGQLARPKFRVHPMKESQFRAFQRGEEVHLAADEPLPIMVHEVGHYLEDHGAVDSWADIQRLIAKRHALAGGGANTERGPIGMRKEGRYGGEYPATGKYTSKAYDTGSTEVMAMTLEYLARPSTFEKMIDKDPVQAATVLRAVQPRAYAAQAGLRAFDKYLPS